MALTDAELLAEVEDILRTMPERFDLDKPDIFSWLGRASAVIKMWAPFELTFSLAINNIRSNMAHVADDAKGKVQTDLPPFVTPRPTKLTPVRPGSGSDGCE